MNRNDFQSLANLRAKEAGILLDNECFEGAYYLAGYAVECALKACIAKQTIEFDFPPDRNTVNRIYSHNLQVLLKEAALEREHRFEYLSNDSFAFNWDEATEWSEQARYQTSISRERAEKLYAAVTDGRDGVLTWLTRFW